MLYNEFLERTNVQVSPEEFAQIHADYMKTDLSKDEYCTIWCDGNEERVRNAKMLRAVAERKQIRRKVAFDAFQKLCRVDYETLCTEILSVDELTEIESLGIEISYFDGCEQKPKRALELRSTIHKVCGWFPL